MWYAFQVKENYNRASQYLEIIEMLKGNRYHKRSSEIFIAGHGKRDNEFGNYIFIQENPNYIEYLWNKLSREKYFAPLEGYLAIPTEELQLMRADSQTRETRTLNYGDVVYIEWGPYSKLWGIVLRVEGDHCEVGLNLWVGPTLVPVKNNILRRERSLFEIWKFRR